MSFKSDMALLGGALKPLITVPAARASFLFRIAPLIVFLGVFAHIAADRFPERFFDSLGQVISKNFLVLIFAGLSTAFGAVADKETEIGKTFTMAVHRLLHPNPWMLLISIVAIIVHVIWPLRGFEHQLAKVCLLNFVFINWEASEVTFDRTEKPSTRQRTHMERPL